MALVTNCANTAATHHNAPSSCHVFRQHNATSPAAFTVGKHSYTHAQQLYLFPLFADLDYDLRVLFFVLLEWFSMCNESRRVPQEGAQW